MNFGEKLKDLRIQKRLTLRDCAAILVVDPSNWSKLERSVTPAPKDITVLESWAEFFSLTGADNAAFFDLAALSRQELPADIADDARVMQALPAFFRAIRGKELEGDKLKEFIEDIRKIHSPHTDTPPSLSRWPITTFKLPDMTTQTEAAVLVRQILEAASHSDSIHNMSESIAEPALEAAYQRGIKDGQNSVTQTTLQNEQV